VPDPGAPALEQFAPAIRNIFVVDPNGVNLELYEQK